VTGVETGIQTCHWHPDQRAGVVCQRCDRPICPRCMHQASVGFHCPDCSRGGAQKVYRGPAALSTAPTVTKVLIGINVAVALLGLVVISGQSPVDVLLSGSGRLIADGGLLANAVDRGHLVGVANGQWWRLVTSGFLHVGLIHLALNMYALWWLGGELERGIGRGRLLTIYGVSLLAGSLGALLTSAPNAPTVGASGAIYGLMGAVVSAYRARGIRVRDSPIFGILLLNLLLTFGLRFLSIGGHIGGLVGGLIAGWLFFDLQARTRNPVLPYVLCGLLAAGCVVASLVVAGNAV
jgi:membrane associated rhomboid family serine protease